MNFERILQNSFLKIIKIIFHLNYFQVKNTDYQNDAPLPQDHFSVKNKGVNRKNIVYNPGNPMFYNCDERIPTSLAPLEMGVIWTRAGPVGKSKF